MSERMVPREKYPKKDFCHSKLDIMYQQYGVLGWFIMVFIFFLPMIILKHRNKEEEINITVVRIIDYITANVDGICGA